MQRRFLVVGGFAGVLTLAGAATPKPVTNPGAQIGGSFTLVDQTGRTVTERDFKGRPMAIAFGFTTCPEVCPTTLAALSAELRALGPDADRLSALFVTVDPERDTPRRLARYLAAFDPRIRGLTGTPAQIARIAEAYDVYYRKVPIDGGGYSVDHSTGVYLMSADGRLVDTIGYLEPQGDAVDKLRALVKR
jgi:protein SCO1/2